MIHEGSWWIHKLHWMDMVDGDQISVVARLSIHTWSDTLKCSTSPRNMVLLRATAPIVHLMGQWCGGHFHIHCSEEARHRKIYVSRTDNPLHASDLTVTKRGQWWLNKHLNCTCLVLTALVIPSKWLIPLINDCAGKSLGYWVAHATSW